MDSPDSWRPGYRRDRRTNPVDDRIALSFEHDLHLLNRSESNFSILGFTGNVYTVVISTAPSCTCPDFIRPCKHILFVLIRVLGVCADDESIQRTTLPESLVSRLLGKPTLPEALARKNFQETFQSAEEKNTKRPRSEAAVEIPEGEVCPVCLDEMENGDRTVGCEKCKNLLHQECFSKWKRSRGSRPANCVMCRARWTSEDDFGADYENSYLSLHNYGSEDNDYGDDYEDGFLGLSSDDDDDGQYMEQVIRDYYSL